MNNKDVKMVFVDQNAHHIMVVKKKNLSIAPMVYVLKPFLIVLDIQDVQLELHSNVLITNVFII
jgi:hypothetical protein